MGFRVMIVRSAWFVNGLLERVLEAAMQSVGVPLHRFAVKREYDPREVYDVLFGQEEVVVRFISQTIRKQKKPQLRLYKLQELKII